MLDKLYNIHVRFEEIERLMASPEVASDYSRLEELARERKTLGKMVALYKKYSLVEKQIKEAEELMHSEDSALVHLAHDELVLLSSNRINLESEIRKALLPVDKNADRNVIMEIRAGAGGNEAALFAGDLFRMYMRYAQEKSWNMQIIDTNRTGLNGYKEVIVGINAVGAYSKLKHESGTHRVQRVPLTESSGRIHTSTATVAVLPEAEEVEVEIDAEDIRVDIYHSGGAGGQNVNKVASAVRITHLPTGIVAVCQDERSQHRNKAKALSVVRARLLDMEQKKQQQELSSSRKSQVGTGDRSEKVRTYNFPQDRITDHRLSVTLHGLPQLLDGDLDHLLDLLEKNGQDQQLEDLSL
jgi:peptide chain release factor 1